MSRTDKDAPYWLDSWWAASHTLACEAGRRACTLPAGPPRRPPTMKHGDEGRLCHWYPLGGSRQPAPPRWFVREVFTAPTRNITRRDCRRAVAEYRATGEVDVIPPTWQHRNGARWDWW